MIKDMEQFSYEVRLKLGLFSLQNRLWGIEVVELQSSVKGMKKFITEQFFTFFQSPGNRNIQ